MYTALICNKVVAYWTVMILVLASGNSVFKVHGQYFYILAGALALFELVRSRTLLMRYQKMWYYLAIMLGIFFCQYLTFNWNTLLGIINFVAKIILGGFIVIALDYRFKYYYLRIMYHLAVISLIFFFLQTALNLTFSLIDVGKAGKSILFYFSHNRAFDRNCGAFWEPGAYGCYLMLVPLLFINKLRSLFTYYKKECVVMFIALLTTQSTTAFLSFGMLILMCFTFKIKSIIKYVYVILALLLFAYIYNRTDFLSEKINNQTDIALDAKGNFSSTRLGTFLFDMHYVQKHPLFGNGLHSRTRYADHPYLMSKWIDGKLAKGGNAFSDYLAKMGLSFYVAFFFFFAKTNRGIRMKDFFTFIIVFIMLLFGEPLFSYPIALSLPFIRIINYQR